jgi:hypothetical protein
MKIRDSGMPDDDYWNSFFDAECVIKKMFGEKGCQGNLGVFQDSCHSLVDFYAASSIGLSGFNVTAPIALQS